MWEFGVELTKDGLKEAYVEAPLYFPQTLTPIHLANGVEIYDKTLEKDNW